MRTRNVLPRNAIAGRASYNPWLRGAYVGNPNPQRFVMARAQVARGANPIPPNLLLTACMLSAWYAKGTL